VNVDALIERSRRPGAFVERRRFTLSRDKAIEKLREFSLRDPAQYVLELVQAAVFAGATYIAVESRPERVLVAWVGGRRLREAELTQLFDYLFADRGDPSQRHLVQLAIGMNAILQRKPRVLRVESGDGTFDHTLRLEVSGLSDARLGEPETGLAGTYVMAEHRHGHWKKWLGRSWTPEEGMVEERCHYTPVPILLNGRAPFGYRASRAISVHGLPDQLAFDEGELRGVLAIPWGHGDGRGVRVVVGGVWVTTTSLPELGVVPPGAVPDRDRRPYKRAPFEETIELAGVVCDDRLRKTADQGDVVRDRRFHRMVDAVRPHATRLLRTVADDYHPAAGTPEAATETEPTWLHLLGPAARVRPAELAHAPAVFRVSPDASPALVAAADPANLPCPVVVSDDEQAAELSERHGLLANPLRSPEDVAFVREVLRRRQDLLVVSPPHAADTPAVVIQLNRRGSAPCWGRSMRGVPALLVVDGAASALAELDLVLPGVSVRVTAVAEDAGWEQAATQALLEALPQLIEGGGVVADDLAAAALAATTWLRQRDHGSPEILLADARLTRWRHLALEGGPSFERLLELSSVERSEAVSERALACLAPLDHLLGGGHVWCSTHPPTACAGRRGDAWEVVRWDEAAGLDELLWAQPAFHAQPPLPAHLTRLEGPDSLVGHAGAPHDTAEGLRLLLRIVAKDAQAATDPVRARQLAQLSRLCQVEHTPPRPPRLIPVDDPASVWAGEGRWVVRLEVEAPGVTGWIGLRAPFDATGSVLVRRFTELRALPDVEAQHPCHGLLEHSGLGPFPYELVRLAVLRLYLQLSTARLAPDLVPVARRYREHARQADREEPAHGLEQIAARVERAFAAVAEPLAVLLEVNHGQKQAVKARAEADASTWRFRLGGDHALVVAAVRESGPQRDRLVLDLAMRIGAALRRERREVDVLQLQQLVWLEGLRERMRT